MAEPAPALNAARKLAKEKAGADSPDVACGLNAARISQSTGSRKASPMMAMTTLGRIWRPPAARRAARGAETDWPARSAARPLAPGRLSGRGADIMAASAGRGSSRSPQLGAQLADVEDGQQGADHHQGQRDRRAVTERVELERLDVHVDRQDGGLVSGAALGHGEDEREVGD